MVKASRIVVWLATLWFFAASFWGIAAIPWDGHIGGGGAGNTMLAETVLLWRQPYPLFDWYSGVEPVAGDSYCHHPFGLFWIQAVASLFFFHKDCTPYLSAALMSTLMPLMLASIGRRIGGPIAGAAAAVGFVIVPIAIGFSPFVNLEVPTMFGATLAFAAHLKYQETGFKRHLALSLIGAAFCVTGDWVGSIILAPLLVVGLFRAFILPSWMTPHIKAARYHRWWALTVAIAVGSMLLHIALFAHADKLMDWIGSAKGRTASDAEVPLADILKARAGWIDFSFTPLCIWIGKAAFPVALIRLVVRRTDAEAMSLAVLTGAVLQYIGFKQAADIHIFWPHYFALYYALALAQLAATAMAIVTFVVKRFAPGRAALAGAIAGFVTFGIPTLLMAPDSYRGLVIFRQSGGRYTEPGRILSQADMIFVLRQYVRPRVARTDTITIYPGTPWNWGFQYAAFCRYTQESTPSMGKLWITRPSTVGADVIKDMTSRYKVRFFEDVMVIDPREARGPAEAFSFHEREPNVFEWMFTNHVQPVREIPSASDPYLTWEWREHLGQQPNALLTAQPATLDEKRIAYNVRVKAGDLAGAELLREQVEKGIDRTAEARFTGGTTLIGVRIVTGVYPRIEAWFIAGGPTDGDATFSIHSVIEKPARVSLLPADPLEQDIAYAPPLATKLWKKGYMYRVVAELRHRVGRERYFGFFNPGPAPANGQHTVNLAWIE